MMKILKTPFFIIAILYLFSFVLMAFNNGVYWDDWTLYDQKPADLMLQFRQNGGVLWGHLHAFLGGFHLPVLYRLVTFTTFFISGLLCFVCVKKINSINESEALLLTLFVMVLPVNSARMTMICLPYSILYMSLIISLFFLLKFLEKAEVWNRLASLFFLFLSVLIPSTSAVFYLLFLFLLFDYSKMKWTDLFSKKFFKLILSYSDFIVLPVLVFVVQYFFMKPTGLYADYNRFSFISILALPFSLVNGLEQTLFEPVKCVFKFDINMTLLVFMTSLIYWFLPGVNLDRKKPVFGKIMFGVLLLLVSILPYSLVGKTPSFFSLSSRHQLYVSLGGAVIIVYGCAYIIKKRELLKVVYSLLLSAFVLLNINNCISYFRDWFKKDAIVCTLKDCDGLYDNKTILVNDNICGLYDDNYYCFYEWNGLFKAATGRTNKLVVDKKSSSTLRSYKKMNLYPNYNMQDYIYCLPEDYITVSEGINKLSIARISYLLVTKLFKPELYETEVKKCVKIDFRKLEMAISDTVPICCLELD